MNWWWTNRRPEILGHRPIDLDLRFYSAAIERAAGRPTRFSQILRATKIFLWSCLFFYSAWCVFDRNMGAYPVTMKAVYPDNNRIRAGDKLYVKFDLYRHKVCQYDMNWSITDAAGNRQGFVEPHKNATGNVGPDVVTRTFQMPDDLTPGPAKLRIVSSWACPTNIYEAIYPMTLILPDINFTVIP